MVGMLSSFSASVPENAPMSTHGPIDIQSEGDLSDLVTDNDWDGNGTSDEPYIIQDVHINYNGGNLGITIKNTDSHILLSNLSCSNWGTNTWFFITLDSTSNITVKDCYFSNCPSPFTIDNSRNILIENCTFVNVTYGIRALFENRNFTVTRCLFESCGHGIIGSATEVSYSSFRNCSSAADLRYDGWTLHHCTFRDNYESVLTWGSNFTVRENDIRAITCAISLRTGSNAVIRDNKADSDRWSSIRIWGLRDSVFYDNRITKGYFEFPSKDLEDFIANSISENNTVGGKPVHTYMNMDMDNASASSGFGQLIAANVSWFSIDNLTVTDVGNPISMAHSSNISISDNVFFRCRYAIDVTYSEDVVINRNNVSDCWFQGVYLGSNQRLDIRNNRFYNNNYSAVSISGGKLQNIQGNFFKNNNWSAVMLGTDGASIRDNTIDRTEYYGIVVHPQSVGNRIHGNHITRSGYHGIYLYQDSAENMIYDNNISLSNDAGIYIYRSENNLIQSNEFYSNRRFGVFVNDTLNARIYSNKMFLDGLHYQYYDGFSYPSGRMVNNNTLNGKQIRIYYGGSWSGYLVPKDTGQVVLLGASDLKLSGIDFSDACSPIVMKTSSSIIVEDCTFQRNSICGIMVTSSPYTQISGCNFTENRIGIITDYGSGAVSEQCSFRNNEFYRNELHGVRTQSRMVMVRDSLFIENGHSGVFIKYAPENTVTGNTFKGNRMGVTLYHAINRNQINRNIFFRNIEYGVYSNYAGTGTPNEIILNVFIENNGAGNSFDQEHVQAFDEKGVDDWYSDTQLGNYWSDWLSPDTDGDNIVDEPYPIGGGATSDQKPLTKHPFTILSRPKQLKAAGGNGNITLSWDEPEINRGQRIFGYAVYRSNESGMGSLLETTGNETHYNDTSVVNNVRYFYYVRAINEFGMGSPSLEVDAWTDGDPPSLVVLDPAEGSYINENHTTIEWESGDGIAGVSHFDISLDGEKIVTGILGTKYDVKDLSNGAHSVTVEAYDAYQNRNLSTRKFTVDLEAPVVDITEPKDGSMYNTFEMVFQWTGMDVFSGIERYLVRIDQSDWIDIGDNTSYTWKVAEEGEHQLSVKAFDLANNSFQNSSSFFIDLLEPVLEISIPENGSFLTQSYLTVEWMTEDPGSGLDKAFISVNNGDFYRTDDISTSFVEDLPEGHNIIVVRVFDKAGNFNETKFHFTVDTQKPHVISYSPQGEDVNFEDRIRIEFSERILEESLVIDANGVRGNVVWENNTVFFEPMSPWEPGTSVEVKVTAIDPAGNEMAPLEWIFRIDDRGTLFGTLKDENGDPMAGAEILLDGVKVGETNSSGGFSYKVAPGTHILTFRKEGYDDLEWSVQISPGGTEELSGLNIHAKEEKGPSDGGDPPILIFIIVGLILLMVLIVLSLLFILRFRKKKEEKPEEGAQEEAELLQTLEGLVDDQESGQEAGPMQPEPEGTIHEDLYGPGPGAGVGPGPDIFSDDPIEEDAPQGISYVNDIISGTEE